MFRMIKSFHIFLIIFSIGLSFKSAETNACGMQKEISLKNCESKSGCKKEDSKITSHKKSKDNGCCDKLTSSETTSTNSNHDCNGHCNHNSCKCAALSFSVNLPQSIDLKLNNYISISNNTIISLNENRLPSGFHSIWLPPVIS